MYFIRWMSGDIYIYNRNGNFPIKNVIVSAISEDIEKPNLKEIRNSFIDRSLILVYDLDFENNTHYPQMSYTTKDGQVIFSNFFVVRDSGNKEDYSFLSTLQVNTVIKELL